MLDVHANAGRLLVGLRRNAGRLTPDAVTRTVALEAGASRSAMERAWGVLLNHGQVAFSSSGKIVVA